MTQRLSTKYIATEDRLRVTCERGGGADGQPPQAFWLTQRVMLRLLPTLLAWLEKQTAGAQEATADAAAATDARAVALHSFAQHSARMATARERQEPVQPIDAQDVWLVRVVNVTLSATEASLTFRSLAEGEEAAAGLDGSRQVTLTLAARPLRQWLNIVHDAFVRAEWPLAVWPAWMRDEPTAGAPAQALRH
jgi:hypothetical protein